MKKSKLPTTHIQLYKSFLPFYPFLHPISVPLNKTQWGFPKLKEIKLLTPTPCNLQSTELKLLKHKVTSFPDVLFGNCRSGKSLSFPAHKLKLKMNLL